MTTVEMTKDGQLIEDNELIAYSVYTKRTDMLEYQVKANSPEEAERMVQDYISGNYEEVEDQPEPEFIGVSDEDSEVITEVIPA
jgi:hypothetical protein